MQTAKKRARSATPASPRDNGTHPHADFKAFLAAMDKDAVQKELCALWDCWKHIMGEDLSYAIPLGHFKRQLLIGCADSMEAQELRFSQAELLDRVHAFLGKRYFTTVRVELMLDRHDLCPLDAPVSLERDRQPPVTKATGIYLADMDETSPVARCYKAFVEQAEAAEEALPPR